MKLTPHPLEEELKGLLPRDPSVDRACGNSYSGTNQYDCFRAGKSIKNYTF